MTDYSARRSERGTGIKYPAQMDSNDGERSVGMTYENMVQGRRIGTEVDVELGGICRVSLTDMFERMVLDA